MAKMGRPTVDDSSLHRVTVRFTESEYQTLKKYAESHNQTMTQVMKMGIESLYKACQKFDQYPETESNNNNYK